MDGDYREYAFTLPDGTVRYEIASCRTDMFVLKAMHGAVSARPVPNAGPDGAGTCGSREMADLERRYVAEGVDDDDMPPGARVDGRSPGCDRE